MVRQGVLSAALLAAVVLAVRGEDWPQFRGPIRDGGSRDTGLQKSWSPGGPRLLWTYTGAGVGSSGPAVVGERLYFCGGRGATEFLIALDVGPGRDPREVWSAELGPLFEWKGN